MKILIIEDEKEIAASISAYLTGENFFCETADTYNAAMEKIALYDYTCIILDINLNGSNGFDVLKELKRNNKTDGVLIISAKNSLDDRIFGLNAGADDYLTKPFYLAELSARVAAIVRRRNFSGNDIISFDALEVNIQSKTVMTNGKPIELTRKEYDLLLYFISNKNKVISKNAIAEHLWGDDMDIADNYDFIYSHIKNLRKKLVAAGSPDYIKSVYGMGYKFKF